MKLSSRLATNATPGLLQRAPDEPRAAGTLLLDLTSSNLPACGPGPQADRLAPGDGPARVLPRRGGGHLVLRLPETEDDDGVPSDLLVHDHVVGQPGFFFDFPEGEHLVVRLLPPAEEFTIGRQRQAARIAA